MKSTSHFFIKKHILSELLNSIISADRKFANMISAFYL